MKKIITIGTMLIFSVSIVILFLSHRSGHYRCRISMIEVHLNFFEMVIPEYIEYTHSLPMWGESFTDDPRFAELFLRPNRKIRDPWGGKYSLTLTEDGSSLLIISAGKDHTYGTKDDVKRRLNIDPNQRLEPIVKTPADEVEAQGTQAHP